MKLYNRSATAKAAGVVELAYQMAVRRIALSSSPLSADYLHSANCGSKSVALLCLIRFSCQMMPESLTDELSHEIESFVHVLLRQVVGISAKSQSDEERALAVQDLSQLVECCHTFKTTISSAEWSEICGNLTFKEGKFRSVDEYFVAAASASAVARPFTPEECVAVMGRSLQDGSCRSPSSDLSCILPYLTEIDLVRLLSITVKVSPNNQNAVTDYLCEKVLSAARAAGESSCPSFGISLSAACDIQLMFAKAAGSKLGSAFSDYIISVVRPYFEKMWSEPLDLEGCHRALYQMLGVESVKRWCARNPIVFRASSMTPQELLQLQEVASLLRFFSLFVCRNCSFCSDQPQSLEFMCRVIGTLLSSLIQTVYTSPRIALSERRPMMVTVHSEVGVFVMSMLLRIVSRFIVPCLLAIAVEKAPPFYSMLALPLHSYNSLTRLLMLGPLPKRILIVMASSLSCLSADGPVEDMISAFEFLPLLARKFAADLHRAFYVNLFP